MTTPGQYAPGTQNLTSVTGKERVSVDAGGAVLASCNTSQIAGLYAGQSAVIPQLITAAGATQGNAVAITSKNAIVLVATTNSLKGVRLPVGATGLEYSVANGATHGVKVYPATGCKIGAANTNVADTLLAINKQNKYRAVNATFWVVERGA